MRQVARRVVAWACLAAVIAGCVLAVADLAWHLLRMLGW